MTTPTFVTTASALLRVRDRSSEHEACSIGSISKRIMASAEMGIVRLDVEPPDSVLTPQTQEYNINGSSLVSDNH